MAFRLDMRLNEGNILLWRFNEYGILKKCLRCPLFNDCNTPQYNAPGVIKFFCRAYKEAKLNNKLKEGDRVSCIINSAIEGEITKKAFYHGVYLYTLKVDDEESFIKHFGLGSVNVVFLHWQLRRE